jgi:hypothetical protein
MTAAKLVRFAAVLVVLAGYLFVFRAGERRIGEQLSENDQTVERLRAGERTIAVQAALVTERARLLAQIRHEQTGGERSLLVARFLRDAATVAAAHRTAITAVTASGAAPIPRPASAQSEATTTAPRAAAIRTESSLVAADGARLDGIALDLTLEGRYADVLATLRALSAGSVPATVDVASLARKNAAEPDAVLTAALRVVLERIDVPSAPEPNDVARQPS